LHDFQIFALKIFDFQTFSPKNCLFLKSFAPKTLDFKNFTPKIS